MKQQPGNNIPSYLSLHSLMAHGDTAISIPATGGKAHPHCSLLHSLYAAVKKMFGPLASTPF